MRTGAYVAGGTFWSAFCHNMATGLVGIRFHDGRHARRIVTARIVNAVTTVDGGLRSLNATGHEHHDRIMLHVDRLPALADMLGRVEMSTFEREFTAECEFISTQLVPHIEAIESTLYGELERLMERRHSMQPMREEHARLRRLFTSLCHYREGIERGRFSKEEQIGLRRVLYRLYSLLKVHLTEEELYLSVIERDLSPEEKDALARGMDHAAAEPV